MASPQLPVPASPNVGLPPVAIDGHALFEFSMRMGRALRRLEHRFGGHSPQGISQLRQTWQPPSRKPR